MEQNVLSPMLIDAIGEIMNISLGSSATAVSNMLDHRVDITTPTVSVVNAEDFELGDVDPAIGVEIKYVSGLEGSNVMMLKRSDVKAMVDILLGSETPDEEFQLDELSISVVCEVMNQMMGSASTALSDFLGRMVNISTPESFELDDLEAFKQEHFPVAHGPIVVVRFQLMIEGILESEFMNVMSVELAKELVAGFGLDEEAMSGGETLVVRQSGQTVSVSRAKGDPAQLHSYSLNGVTYQKYDIWTEYEAANDSLSDLSYDLPYVIDRAYSADPSVTLTMFCPQTVKRAPSKVSASDPTGGVGAYNPGSPGGKSLQHPM